MIQQKLQSGRYETIDDLLSQAFQLLDDWDEHSLTEDPAWIESIVRISATSTPVQ